MVYPALLLLTGTPQLPAVNGTDAPADLNGFIRLAERRNLVSACVPSHFKFSLSGILLNTNDRSHQSSLKCTYITYPLALFYKINLKKVYSVYNFQTINMVPVLKPDI